MRIHFLPYLLHTDRTFKSQFKSNMTELNQKKTMKKNKWKALRLSLKYRPKIMNLILKMRRGIRRRNAEIKLLKHHLSPKEEGNDINGKAVIVKKICEQESKNSNTFESKTFTDSSTQTLDSTKSKSKYTSRNNETCNTNTDIKVDITEKSGWKSGDSEKSIADQVKEAALNALTELENSAGWNVNSGDTEKSIADQVKEVAQSAMQQSGMVYVESAGMYYDYKTGYYYNSELGLYYHTDTNCYYYFSDEKQQFVFHSYPDTSAVNTKLIAHQKKKARKLLKRDNEAKKPKKRKLKKNELSSKENKDQTEKKGSTDQKQDENKMEEDADTLKTKDNTTSDTEVGEVKTEESNNSEEKKEESKMEVATELEDGECSDSSSDDDSSSNASTATVSDEDSIAKHHPPCMRVIVRETDLPKLKVGSLYLITKDGGTIGREGDQHALLIKDHNVSRNHLDVKYDMQRRTYVAMDLGSKNGTILNGNRMSESTEISEPMDILHGSTIQLGETKLLCHIHAGNDTCGHCEPGLLMETEEKEKKAAYTRSCSVKKQHELELARLKNIYAPQLLAIEEKPYNDRAQARRETVGSSHHSAKTESTDLDTSISTENKGFKLLQKMGWSEGEGLGKDSQGNTEPVPMVSNEGKAGLGTSGAVSAPPLMPKPRPKNTIASATMRLAARTKMLQPPAKAFQHGEEDDSE